MKYFPNETTVKARTMYSWTYKIHSKIVASGRCLGKDLVKLAQYKHHNVNTWHEFEFCVA